VLTIHPGIDQDFFLPKVLQSRSEPARLLFPGAPLARKNLELVLHCLAGAPAGSALAHAALDISGAREEAFPRYSALIRSLGLWERVRWLGQVPREDVPSLMAAATAIVYPSFYEGFGFPPLEAMAAGTPVVASNASCLPEVLGDAAILVDPKDGRAFATALEGVLTRPELRARLVAAGRERARQFTWDRSAQCTVEAYERVLKGAA
jgi:glycosyltransferase involved in cell wall biosynthesis